MYTRECTVKEKMLLGLYEKAFPPSFGWDSRCAIAHSIGFDFIELSIDESDERLARLSWDKYTCHEFIKTIGVHGITVPSMCLSGLRRFPLGASDVSTRDKGSVILSKAIELAANLGIEVIQVAGYDVYGEPSTEDSMQLFLQNLGMALREAEHHQVVLAIENMETATMDSLEKIMHCVNHFDSPFLKAYVDAGNLIAMGYDVADQLEIARGHVAGFHIKDVLPGVCRNIAFGDGIVDFHQLFTELGSFGFSGRLLVEMWAEASDDPLLEIAQAYRFLIKALQFAGFSYKLQGKR